MRGIFFFMVMAWICCSVAWAAQVDEVYYLVQSHVAPNDVGAQVWGVNGAQLIGGKSEKGAVSDMYHERPETVTGNLSLYASVDAWMQKKAPVDNCIYTYSGLTKKQVKDSGKDLQVLIYDLIQQSVLVDGVETNLLQCGGGVSLGFQGAIRQALPVEELQ